MPKITKSMFVIAVSNLKVSSAFYRDVLGFEIQEIPDPGFLFYHCGECTIFAGECPDALPAQEIGDHSYFAYLHVDDIDSYAQSVTVAGAKICKTLRDEPWGMREFGVVTVDGHRIMFGKPKQN
jgi:predicted enzyme related to lactoylglutathione lyase